MKPTIKQEAEIHKKIIEQNLVLREVVKRVTAELEEKNREARIEAALERVRSKTMAMHNSQDVAATIASLFDELVKLGIDKSIRCGIGILNDSTTMELWTASSGADGEVTLNKGKLDIRIHPLLVGVHDAWKNKTPEFSYELRGQDMVDYYTAISDAPDYQFHIDVNTLPERMILNEFFFTDGTLFAFTKEELPGETGFILKRFAAVFGQTYRRYLDLLLAEASVIRAEEDLQKLHAEKKKTEIALAVLQETQKQLIQSEKMASLGELTAGIAHEIQNPLNFVNNFSEVNKELLGELKDEIRKGNFSEVIGIAENVMANEEKINHHGKRADAIVKGMLQHSRGSNGVKDPTDINALCDEYLRLAYHGLRAKDNAFNVTIKTEYDDRIGKINIIPQEIGRVVLNLINNAFYAVTGKQDPLVTVSTKKSKDNIEIKVEDNGNGIPQKVLDKIFQPFFTTKPTGQGTGLGLSVSYDVVKAHGGEIKVNTSEGAGSAFIVSLPAMYSNLI